MTTTSVDVTFLIDREIESTDEEYQCHPSVAELKALRHSLARGTPFGHTHWQRKTAAILGLESSLRARGRPKQQGK